MASNQMEVAALGRPFTLGMLYDAQRDALITGLTLWDDKTLQGKMIKSPKPSSNFFITESDSIESKSSLLEVNSSLKASYLFGLIDVEGSAKYLKDHKEFKNQSRVTGQYKSTTRLEQLSLTDLMTLEPQQKDVIIKSSATHIVTGILYGANAFFVFDSEKLEVSKVGEIGYSMKAMVTKIPSLSSGGPVDNNLTKEEKNLSAKVSCKFFGDFTLQSIPLTYEEAVKTFGQLPQLLGENGEKAVPMKVWLMPLTNLCPEAAKLTSEISIRLVVKMQRTLENLVEIQMRSNESLEDRAVQNFPHIKEELTTFQKLCHLYTSNLQGTMKEKLSSIREGKEDESSLEKNFEKRDKSPFSQEKLMKWLDDKEREINVIRSCVETMEGTKIVKNQSELDREVLAADVDNTLCFVFTSTKRSDTYLDEMTTYLDTLRLGSTSEDEWFNSDEVLTFMRKKAKVFQDFCKAKTNNNRIRFLIAAIPNEKFKGATIYHYKQGILVSEDFSGSDLYPEKMTDRRDLMLYACDLTLDPNTANNYLVLSDGNKKVTSGSKWQKYPDNPERFDKYTQVLCGEGLSGRHYWEVEWDNASASRRIYVAVAYKTIKRKGNGYCCEFGNNKESWAFGQRATNVKHALRAWHNGWVWGSYFLCDGCSTLGVYLDWPAGHLSFYKVSSDTLTHLYTFNTTFTEPVYPGFWVYYKGNYAYLRPLK
ncbi:neoverrucotoxin subunit alpha-like [Pungitius pungitius]|uniref:neoverrucotoxin subunit alpha-like n=1 Tax=Pungitius pungitius TaxID=134920 RepID=UPI001887A17F|nr:neoverrucotoxin subunit alpha-like [Pungitius pungitius]